MTAWLLRFSVRSVAGDMSGGAPPRFGRERGRKQTRKRSYGRRPGRRPKSDGISAARPEPAAHWIAVFAGVVPGRAAYPRTIHRRHARRAGTGRAADMPSDFGRRPGAGPEAGSEAKLRAAPRPTAEVGWHICCAP